jgi:hypothetical protein
MTTDFKKEKVKSSETLITVTTLTYNTQKTKYGQLSTFQVSYTFLIIFTFKVYEKMRCVGHVEHMQR